MKEGEMLLTFGNGGRRSGRHKKSTRDYRRKTETDERLLFNTIFIAVFESLVFQFFGVNLWLNQI